MKQTYTEPTPENPLRTIASLLDYVERKLVEQNKRSFVVGGGECGYRGYSGEKCAIGWLISDASYSEEFEGRPARDVMDAVDLVDLDSLREQLDGSSWDVGYLFARMQAIHDFIRVESWGEAFFKLRAALNEYI